MFARAREKARQNNCLSNIKQIGLSWQMYYQDYDETFLQTIYRATPAYIWTLPLVPYIKNEQIFACPSNSAHRLTYYADANRGYMSVGYNWYFADRLVRLSDMQYPAQAVIFGDTYNGDANLGYRGYEFAMATRNCDTFEALGTRHNEGINLGFADGHAKWMSTQAINGRQGI